jgi:hypothetical protein
MKTRRTATVLWIASAAWLLIAVHAGAQPVPNGCLGDCDHTNQVTVDELVSGVGIALGSVPLEACPSFDSDDSESVTVDELVQAVNNALNGCPAPTPTPRPTPTPEGPCPQRNALRNVYYGDLHVHTGYSFDAYLWENRRSPADAYRFARGEPALLPPLDAHGNGTRLVRIERPLDFAAVTDHAEYLGEIELCTTPGTAVYDTFTCVTIRALSPDAYITFGIPLISARPTRLRELCGSDGRGCLPATSTVWGREVEAANTAHEPCQFTAFVAYEYSRSPGGSTLHRNVIFRNDRVPLPISAFEQASPQGLWRQLQTDCLDAGIGCDVLAIPHNSNESNGRAFFVEYPGAQTIDDQRSLARLRRQSEPLVELYQHKGDSECINGLSGLFGEPDEQCNFEKRRQPPLDDCGDRTGGLGAVDAGCISRNDFLRGALLTGLKEQDRLGVNPYQLGFIGSTDTHNAIPGFTGESSFVGHQGANDAAVAALLGEEGSLDDRLTYSPGGLAAIWAEENTRASLFDALRRRETFATSGTRLSVRVFGGWSLPANLCEDPNLVQVGYERGVPMGGVLPDPPSGSAPMLVISALRDAGTDERPGTPLQRVQVIKGWTINGEAHYAVYDVAGNADNGATVDSATCTPQGTGADSLCATWTDPDFDPARSAFYYVRVLENPTCRWNTWMCNRLAPDERPPSCTDPTVPKVIQERAWTSPIWYVPE